MQNPVVILFKSNINARVFDGYMGSEGKLRFFVYIIMQEDTEGLNMFCVCCANKEKKNYISSKNKIAIISHRLTLR